MHLPRYHRSFDKYDIQDVAIEKFRQFATDRNVHVTLVCHPRKEAEAEKLTMASIYGSAKATQEADTVLILQTDGNRKYVEVKKNRFNGVLGSCPLHFDRKSCRYSDTPVEGAPQTSPSPPSSPFAAANSSSRPKASAQGNSNHWEGIFA
jgi:twinkle protein